MIISKRALILLNKVILIKIAHIKDVLEMEDGGTSILLFFVF